MKKLSKNEWVAVTFAVIVVFIAIIVPSFQFGFTDALFGNDAIEISEFGEPDSLIVQDVIVGDGSAALVGDRLTVHYTGSLLDGTIFDSSLDNNTPFTFTLGRGDVIEGWDRGLVGMREGGVRLLLIPPDLGYGSVPRGAIPADARLIFEVQLLEVKTNE